MLRRPSEKEKEGGLLLPTDVTIQILLKLPTMSVLRFHCVSKQWFSILKDEYFCNLHSEVLRRPESPLRSYLIILFFTAQIQQQLIITFSTSGSTSHHTIKIYAHKDDRDAVSTDALNRIWWFAVQCNGLVGMVPYVRLMEHPIIVCNPLTLEYLSLPPCTTSNVLCSSFGLGFSPLAKQYKVVCVRHFKEAPEQATYPCTVANVMEVYTLGDTTWKVVDLHVDFKPRYFQTIGIYDDGKIYWLIWGPCPAKYYLFAFEVESEKCSVVGSLPIAAAGQGLESKLSDFKLAKLESGVSLIVNRGSVIEVWMLKEYSCTGGGNCPWVIRQKIRLPDDFVGPGGETPSRFRLKTAWEFGGEDLVIEVDVETKRRIFYYQVLSSVRQPDHVRISVNYMTEYMLAWYPCFGYKPSLASLKKYRRLAGEVVVDGGLDSSMNTRILPPTV